MFGKKKQAKAQSKTLSESQIALQEAYAISKSVGTELRPIKPNLNDKEFRSILKETQKAYGLWYIYVRKYSLDLSMYVTPVLTLDDAITEVDSLMMNAVQRLLLNTIGVRYIDSEMADDEGFVYIPIRKALDNIDSDGKNRVVPALKKIGVVYDDFVTDFSYDIAYKYFKFLMECVFNGMYPELKSNLAHNTWIVETKYDPVGFAYWIKWILNRLHYPNNYEFSLRGNRFISSFFSIGIACSRIEDRMEFDIGYIDDSNGVIVKRLNFYSTPIHITLASSDEEFVALAEHIIADYLDKEYKRHNRVIEFEDDDDYDDEYR